MILSIRASDFYQTPDSLHTSDLGRCLGKEGLPGTLVIISGPMGIGKTEWARGVAQGLGVPDGIMSPTFLYVQLYPPSPDRACPGFLHADWDRVEGGSEDLEDSLLEGMENRVTLVEWGEKLPESVMRSFPVKVHVSLSWVTGGRGVGMEWCSVEELGDSLLNWRQSFDSCARPLGACSGQSRAVIHPVL